MCQNLRYRMRILTHTLKCKSRHVIYLMLNCLDILMPKYNAIYDVNQYSETNIEMENDLKLRFDL